MIRAHHAAAVAAYALSIPAANWMIDNVGTQPHPGGPHTIPVGFGLAAPSGVLCIGVALVARDAVHRTLGKRAALACIVAGVILSAAVAPSLALASAVAFGLGELADLTVYSPLAERRLYAAVLLSGVAGAVVDSVAFLWLAFGSLDFLAGNTVGKVWASALALPFIWATRAVSVRLHPVGA